MPSRLNSRNAASTIVRPSSQMCRSFKVMNGGVHWKLGDPPIPLMMIEAGFSFLGARVSLTGARSLMLPWTMVNWASRVEAGILCSVSISLRSLDGVRARAEAEYPSLRASARALAAHPPVAPKKANVGFEEVIVVRVVC